MENQKIINLLDKIDTDSKHFATKKWYIINDENNTNYDANKDILLCIKNVIIIIIVHVIIMFLNI